jgi:Vacuolar sorting protein 9 (VPS9) domain
MLKKEMCQILNKTLSQDDSEWAGVKQCFNSFYESIREKLLKDEILSHNVDEHMAEIIDFIMLRLYKQIFSQNKIQSKKEYEVYNKITSLQWLDSTHFGIQVDSVSKPLWEVAIKELQSIERCLSPKTKLNCIYSCFKLLDSTFSLFTTEDGVNSACADDILSIFPYIVLKAKIERLQAHLL